MNQVRPGVKSNRWSKIVKSLKKIMAWTLFLVVIVAAAFIYWKYFFTYSEGYRAGLLQKFSSKGTIFKTYEGELILSSISSTRDVMLASEKFYFTLANKSIARQLDTLQGEVVILHYKQKNGKLFFRGDSEYLVDSVKMK